MADPRIQIIIDALNLAGDELKAIDKQLGGLQPPAKKAASTFQTLKSAIIPATAALAAVGFAAKQAYQFISEGAQLEVAEIKFGRLAESIGTTSAALMNQLGPAVSGMLSDAEQMQLAGDLMSLGLAKTSEEAVRLTAVAAQLGMNMNQLVLTLTNQTTMRFDALGVAVDGFDERVKRLKDSGMSADEAFKWAFIEQAEAQIEKVGSVADTTAGKIKVLESSWQNLTDATKRVVVEGVSPLIEKLSNEAVIAEKVTALNKLGLITDERRLEIGKALMDGTADYAEILSTLDTIQQGADATARSHAQALEQTNIALTAASPIMQSYADRAIAASTSNYEFAASMDRQAEATEAANVPLLIAGQRYSQLSTNIMGTVTALKEQIEFLTAGGGVLVEMAAQAQEALDAGNIIEADALTNAMAIGVTDMELELGKIDATEAETRLTEQLGMPPDVAKAKVAELQETLFALTAQDWAINFNVTGLPSGTPGAGGGYTPPNTGGGGGGGNDLFSVAPGGSAVGGGTTNVYIDTIMVDDGTDFLSMLAAMKQSSTRNSASARAGSAYIGT